MQKTKEKDRQADIPEENANCQDTLIVMFTLEYDDIDCNVDFCYAMSLDDMAKTFNEALISDEASY